MGFHDSPGVGQACSWAIVLHSIDNMPEDQRSGLGLNTPQQTDFSKYLEWLPLTNGGALFVLIDGIFVIHPSKAVVAAWRKRIAKKCAELHAVLKDERDEATLLAAEKNKDEKKPLSQEQLNAEYIQQVELVRDDPTISVKFAGTRISGAGFKVAKEMEVNNLLEQTATAWEGTYRDLASAMSTMLWHFRSSQQISAECRQIHGCVRKSVPRRQAERLEQETVP